MVALARIIRTVTGLVVLVIAVAIALWVLSANPHNAVVSDIHDAGAWLAGPFKNLFSIKGAKLHLAINWGVAAVVYLIVGSLLATMAARSGLAGRRYRRVGTAV